MALFDFMFPEISQATHLGNIAEAAQTIANDVRRKEVREAVANDKVSYLQRRVKRLENDMAMLAMVNALLLKKYIRDTGKSPDELHAELRQVDLSDDVADGGLDTNDLRRLLGIELQDPLNGPSTGECPECGRQILTRRPQCLFCGCVFEGTL